MGVQVTTKGDSRDWLSIAACKDAPAEIFFPAGGIRTHSLKRAFNLYCKRCPVWGECFEASFQINKIANDEIIEEAGIWAGLSPQDRQLYRGKPRKAWAKASGKETR